MEALQGVVKEMYTSFILRDFLGNIVPGSFFLFSMCVMFIHPLELLKTLSGRISIVLVLLLAGVAWLIGLAISGVAHFLVDIQFHTSAGEISDILRPKVRVDAVTFERMIIIGQSARHFLCSLMFSLPAWLVFIFSYARTQEGKFYLCGDFVAKVRSALVVLLTGSLMLGMLALVRNYTLRTLIVSPAGTCIEEKATEK
jgi:hypothetical protein